MVRRPGSGSLFWTLAGAFFGVLVLTVILQSLMVVWVVEPVSRRWQQSRAERVAEQVASSLGSAFDEDRRDRIEPILRDVQQIVDPDHRQMRVIYIDESDLAHAWPPTPRPLRAVFGGFLRGEREFPAEWGRGRGRGQGQGRRETWEMEVLARTGVSSQGVAAGEVFVVQAPRRLSILNRVPERALLFLPVSLLVAGLAGLWIFHRLRRRLERLEAMAGAVGEGRLEARIEDPGSDEIGRLGERLNEMAGRLALARDAVAASDTQRRQLLADITHELATPLTSIRGFAETLLDGDVPLDGEKREQYIAHVLHAAERMDVLIRDLLDLARLEAGSGEFEVETLDFSDLVERSVQRFQPQFDVAELRVRFASDRDCTVEVDGLRVEQVVDNLLVNALRYVPAGGAVEVEVRRDGPWVRLTVCDDGPGIDPGDLEHVFDRFYRADRSRSAGGSGLGLAIVREIVRRHGGEVSAHARTPRGTELRVLLPSRGE